MKARWRVLVVDDHAPSRAAVAEAVAALGGVIVGTGASSREAPELAERCRPDAIILAPGLPGGGVTAAREIMATAPCPIVLLTGRTDSAVIREARAAGVMAFLLNPVGPEQLGPALDIAIARFRDLEAVRRENVKLKKALEARKVVERAKGLLMERQGLTEPEAFRRIQKTAMDNRRPMVEVAQALLLIEGLGGQPAPR